ncbi:MAG: hypothetical protein QF663_01025 [Verrucomicrobiota bacterium]|nr:hypothetical protein [Verrucomicrobiota bacterium]
MWRDFVPELDSKLNSGRAVCPFNHPRVKRNTLRLAKRQAEKTFLRSLH